MASMCHAQNDDVNDDGDHCYLPFPKRTVACKDEQKYEECANKTLSQTMSALAKAKQHNAAASV